MQFIYCDLSDGFLNIIPESHKKDTLFNLAYLRPLLVNANQMRPFISFHGEPKQQIESLFFELITESQQENRLSETYIRSNLLRLLTLIVQKYEKFSLDSDYELFSNYRIAIQNALNYIDEHYTQNITLAEISRIAMMSVRSFSSVFKQITGKTFLEYIHYLRVRDACEKLRNSNASLTSVCYACGFSDLTYFGRIFKKVTGETPSSYRKIYRNPSQMR